MTDKIHRWKGEEPNVTIPAGTKEIMKGAFSFSNNLESVVMPEGLVNIRDRAFWGCRNLKKIEIPNSLEKIGREAFGKCYPIEVIKIPANVTKMDGSAFPKSFHEEAVSKLHGIEVDKDNPAFTSVEGIVYSKDMKTLVAYPSGKKDSVFSVPDSVTAIGKDAFSCCFNLEEVILPKGCRTIKEGAFCYCKRLAHINLEHVKQIKKESFMYCEALKQVDLRGLKIIENNSFHGCVNLSDVTFGKTETIKEMAFINCKALDRVELPSTLMIVEEFAFSGFAMQGIEIPKTVQQLKRHCFGGAKTIKCYETVRGNMLTIGKMHREPNSTVRETAFEIIVLGESNNKVKRVIPMYCDGTFEMEIMLEKALHEDNTFDYNLFDSYFNQVKSKKKKIDIALCRLKYPYELKEQYKDEYIKYLKKYSVAVPEACLGES